MHARHPVESPAAAGVVLTDDITTLARVRDPGVQAVIFAPPRRPSWEAEVCAAVEGGVFAIDRCVFSVERSEMLVHVLEQSLPQLGLPFTTRLALIDDLSSLADRLTETAGCRGVLVRLLVEAPTEHCGYHVDTVAPGVPPFGVLKVYNGPGTLYVDAVDVIDMSSFYDYLGRRERFVREWRRAVDEGRITEADERRAAMRALDAKLPFLRESATVHEIPTGAVVAFRHLDIRDHWSAHSTERAWIHCSPMAGATRLVASLTPLDAVRRH